MSQSITTSFSPRSGRSQPREGATGKATTGQFIPWSGATKPTKTDHVNGSWLRASVYICRNSKSIHGCVTLISRANLRSSVDEFPNCGALPPCSHAFACNNITCSRMVIARQQAERTAA